MRKFTYGVLVVTAAMLVQGRPVQAETAKEIIQKAIDAHGGLDALKKYPGGKMTFKGTAFLLGMEIPLQGETTYLLPDRFKNVVNMEALGMKIAVVQIINGDKMKVQLNGADSPLDDATKEQIKTSKNTTDISELYPLLDEKVYTLSVIEKPGKVGDKEVVGVLVKSKDNKDAELFFDAKTFVFLKLKQPGRDPFTKQEVSQEMIMSDHKKFDGILRQSKFEVLAEGKKTMTIEITDYKHLEKVDKKEFDISD